ncbi:MAG: hypothetical protein SFY70_08530 [Bacteroidia bacterium]|nr:hypothetical protein [Bacteroidia bacterium]
MYDQINSVREFLEEAREVLLPPPEGKPPPSFHVVPKNSYSGFRNRPVGKLIDELNSSYSHSNYNSCAVLARRVLEIFLIDSFIKAGSDHLIRDSNGNYGMLAAIISIVKSGNSGFDSYLSRNVKQSYIDKIKEAGDLAAHHRTHLVSRNTIDDLKTPISTIVSDFSAYLY